jgi:hypothetical protein
MVITENFIVGQMEREKKGAAAEVIHKEREPSVRSDGVYHAAQFHD